MFFGDLPMSKAKRATTILICLIICTVIMSAVLKGDIEDTPVFYPSSVNLTVSDADTLLPIDGCEVVLIGEDVSLTTDSAGGTSLPEKRLCIIAHKDGYAPYILLWHDFSKECASIFLSKGDKVRFNSKLDDDYARDLIKNYLPS